MLQPIDPEELQDQRYVPHNALSEEDEVQVFRLKRAGLTIYAISKEMDISRRTVGRVLSRNVKAKKYKPCGTNAGYARHKRNNEYPCGPCLKAHADNVKWAQLNKRLKESGIKFWFPK